MDTNYKVKFTDNNEVMFVLDNDYLCSELSNDTEPRCICMTDRELEWLMKILIEKYNVAARNELIHKVPVDDELVSIRNKVIDLVIEGWGR